MTPKEYTTAALATERTPNISWGRDMSRLFHGMVGICTEVGELQDAVKKHVIYNKPLDITNIKEELGDILWYVALVADSQGLTLEECMAANVAKLAKRYGGKFTEEAALNRDVNAEARVLADSSKWWDDADLVRTQFQNRDDV